MSKRKTVYVCQSCGYDAVKWSGKCPGCGNWNTMTEEFIKDEAPRGLSVGTGAVPVAIDSMEGDDTPRLTSGSPELDRVLGDGLMPGSLVLIVGEPGIGKSSLTLQIAAHGAKRGAPVLYVTGEESARQIHLRARRLDAIVQDLYVLSETNLEEIQIAVAKMQPSMLIIDSIQTMYRPDIPSAPGSVSQVRESAALLLRLTKTMGMTTLVVGHVTKDGTLAGPRVLEHIVDTVLYFEGERNTHYRILRAVKNRFGGTNEVGLFEMRQQGLVDVPDASRVFLEERPFHVSGSVVVPTIEGTRPLLVEIQALVSPSPFIPPRRTSDSVDMKRIQLLLAVLEKRTGMHLGASDVFVKVAGGIEVDEPAIDLGLAIALASSHRDLPVEPDTVIMGEVGLAGEVRGVSRLDQRLREAERMGFKKAVIPRGNQKGESLDTRMELVWVSSLRQALEAVLGI